MPWIRICDRRFRVGSKPQKYGAGSLSTYGTGSIGAFVKLGRQKAKEIAQAFDVRLPRPGWEVRLCGAGRSYTIWLVNNAGRFEIDSRGLTVLSGLGGSRCRHGVNKRTGACLRRPRRRRR